MKQPEPGSRAAPRRSAWQTGRGNRRPGAGGRPLRVFHAFDPRRVAILLIGGDKTGRDDFYQRMIPMADRLYDEHLAAIAGEGGDGGRDDGG